MAGTPRPTEGPTIIAIEGPLLVSLSLEGVRVGWRGPITKVREKSVLRSLELKPPCGAKRVAPPVGLMNF